MKLSEMEEAALDMLRRNGGTILESSIHERNTLGVFGMEPGLGVFRKLKKKGLVEWTEPEELGGVELTPMIFMVEEVPDVA